jgi:hypothetical protein
MLEPSPSVSTELAVKGEMVDEGYCIILNEFSGTSFAGTSSDSQLYCEHNQVIKHGRRGTSVSELHLALSRKVLTIE